MTKIQTTVLLTSLFFVSSLSAQKPNLGFSLQLCPEIYSYQSTEINSTTFDNETASKTTVNHGITTNGYIGVTDQIWINLGISFYYRTFSTLEGFDQNLHSPEGSNTTPIYMMTYKQNYYILEYPLGFTLYLRQKDKRIKPKLIGNIIGKQLLKIQCNFKHSDSYIEKQNQFYGTAANLGAGLDYHLNDKIILELNCLYRLYNLNREQPILFGDNEKYFNDNKGIMNFAIGLKINPFNIEP